MSTSDQPWHAEKRLTPQAASAAANAGFGVAFEHVRPLGEGWDFATYLADDAWVLRFPKRSECSDVLLREARILRMLEGAELHVAVPRFEHVSGPVAEFPWHFAAYRYLPGTPLNELDDPSVARGIAPVLGRFLGALHALDVEPMASPWGEDDGWKRREFEATAEGYPKPLRERMAAFLREPPAARPSLPEVLTHGDLNYEHLLIDEGGELVGVIDWADAYTTHRTVDYIGLYYLTDRETVRRAYAEQEIEPDETEWRWLEHAAIAMCVGQIYYGRRTKQPSIERLGLANVARFLG